MHENRETPSPTVSESRSPAGEGESRTSGMHGNGESDGAAVPMKPSNKAAGQAPEAAERVEGRAPTKENVQQSRHARSRHSTEFFVRARPALEMTRRLRLFAHWIILDNLGP